MKTILFIALFALPFILFAQTQDSLIITNQIDSLFKLDRNFSKERKWDESLEVLKQAKQLSVETFGIKHPLYAKTLANQGRTYSLMRKYDESEQCFIQAKELQEKYLGKENADYANTLNNFSNLYKYVGQWQKAEPLLLECLEIRERVLGKDHHNYANTLINLSGLYHSMGDFEKAEYWYVKSKDILIKVLGKDHPNYASFLGNLAFFYKTIGQFKKAEVNYVECLDIRERVAGKDHPDYISALRSLGFFYISIKEYDKAEHLLIEGRDIALKNLGKDSLDYAQIIFDLGILSAEKGQFQKAEAYYLESKNIRKRKLGTDHPTYFTSIGALAILYTYQYKHEKAELLYLESVEKTRNFYGENHLYYATELDNLANLYYYLGDYQRAEPLYLKSKSIIEKVLGKKNNRYASIINNLANLFKDLGQYPKAEKLLLESIALKKEAFGENHPDYASSLFSLASLYMSLDQFEKADSIFLITKKIQEQHLDNKHPNYISTLNNMGLLYKDMGQYQKAESFFLSSLNLKEKVYEEDHPDIAGSLNNLAIIYSKTGQYEKADSLFLKSKEIYQRSVGKGHPGYLSPLKGLAILNERIGQYKLAEEYLNKVAGLQQSRLSKAVSFLSEKELFDYNQLFHQNGQEMLNFALERYSQKTQIGELPGLCFNNLLFYKGFLLNSAKQMNILANKNSATKELYNELNSYRRHLAREYAKTINIRDTSLVENLEEKANTTEKELAHEVAGYTKITQQVTWKAVQASLKTDEAAIEFVHIQVNFPIETDSVMYAALVLLPNNKQPQFVPLFEEKQLEVLLSLKIFSTKKFVDKLYTTELNRLLWQPLDSLFQDVKTIYYSPSGLLHRIAFPAIPSDGSMLADKYDLQYVSSTRNLVFKDSLNNNEPVTNAIVYGGITYETDSTEIALASTGTQRSENEYRFNETELLPQDPTRGRGFGRLDTTLVELNRLEYLFKSNHLFTMTLEGINASEESFKAIGQQFTSPDILHIATHGFFFPDPKIENSESDNFITDGKSNFKYADNPLLRSGLILAGANHAWKEGESLPGFEDGILTAYEISNMDLTNTKLVVLSACKTGLGEIKGSEGVYGLQRAFKMAGVDYLIITLWNIPDSHHTVEFMEAFYTKWIAGKMPIRQAFNDTQKEMKNKYSHPYYWAGFALIE